MVFNLEHELEFSQSQRLPTLPGRHYKAISRPNIDLVKGSTRVISLPSTFQEAEANAGLHYYARLFKARTVVLLISLSLESEVLQLLSSTYVFLNFLIQYLYGIIWHYF